MTDAVIVATARSAIGRAHKGSFTGVRPDDMLASIVTSLLDKVPQLDRTEIDDLIVGSALTVGEQGGNLARVVALLAGIDEAPGTVVNRACASSLQSIRMAAHAVRADEGDVFVSGGVESVSRLPASAANYDNPRFAEARQRTEARTDGTGGPWQPGPGLADVFAAMGATAENVREIEGIGRRELDEFALMSQTRAAAAQEQGFFEREITPLTLADGTVVQRDESIRPSTTLEGLAQLAPVFRADGAVTAGNACPLNDGAAAVLVMSDRRAGEIGVEPIARIVASAVSAINPEIMGLGPVEACRRVMTRAGMTIDDIDLVEINEAFAAQVLPSARQLGIPLDKLNVHGGAIALGHPFGMTGARIMTTLLNGLETTGGTIGLESMCIGGGQGMAMIVERLK